MTKRSALCYSTKHLATWRCFCSVRVALDGHAIHGLGPCSRAFDYGRDRMAYQAYEQLFDPELPPRQRSVQPICPTNAGGLRTAGRGWRTHGGWPFQGARGPHYGESLPERSGWPTVAPPALRQLLGGDLPKSQSDLRALKGEAKRLCACQNCRSMGWCELARDAPGATAHPRNPWFVHPERGPRSAVDAQTCRSSRLATRRHGSVDVGPASTGATGCDSDDAATPKQQLACE